MRRIADRWSPVVPARVDAALALGLLVLAQVETVFTDGYQPSWLYLLAAAAMTVPLAWRRVFPLPACFSVFAVLVGMQLAGQPLDAAYVMAALIVALYSVGAHTDRRSAVTGWVATMGLLALLILLESGPGAGDFVFVAAIITGAWAVGVVVRERTQQNAALVERTIRLEVEREVLAARAVADERARIARELHDVIAHSMSIVVVQTAAVRRRLQGERPGEAAQLEEVEKTTRQALQEMRRLLGILRTDDSRELAPQPGLQELSTLLHQMRQAGLPVDLQVRGEPRPLPAGLDLTAYRVVQEALVNVLKHTSGASAKVVASYDDFELGLTVTDTGDPQRRPPAQQPGHGLVGMRERVQLYGGTVHAGPIDGAGFRVEAHLPLQGP